jgi:hypothetical protein
MKTGRGVLRVIGGELKGRRLRAPAGDRVRPTADRVREALFDILGARAAGASFLDAYAGTGAVGVEALSRGASSATSRSTVPSVYQDFVDDDGTEIDQDLRLRIVPISFTIRVLPLGQSSRVQPYFGAGLGVFAWRYSESGEFVDFSTTPPTIFRDQFVASGSETGPMALGGIRFAADSFSAGFEVRYQSADAELGPEFAVIADEPRIDLGGWNYLFTVGWRFGR